MLGILPTIGLLGPSMGDGAFASLGFGLLAGFTGQLIGAPEQLTHPGYNQDFEGIGFGQMGALDAQERAWQSAGLNQYLGNGQVSNYGPLVNGPSWGNQPFAWGQGNGGVAGGRGQVGGGVRGNYGGYQNCYGNQPSPNYGFSGQCQFGGYQSSFPFPPCGSYFPPSSCGHAQYFQQQQCGQQRPPRPRQPGHCAGAGGSTSGSGSSGGAGGVGSGSTTPAQRYSYPRVPQVGEGNWGSACAVLDSRLSGSSSGRNTITFNGNDPRSNSDGKANLRTAVWTIMQQDDSLRYNVDTGKFFRSFGDGSNRDVLDVSAVTSLVSQFSNDPRQLNLQVGSLLNQLPSDQALYGGAGPISGGVGSNGPITPPTPAQQNPQLAQQLLNQLQGQSDALDINQFLEQALGIRQLLAGGQVRAVGTEQGVKTPFSITAHSYYNQERQESVPVNEVLIFEKGNYNDRTREYNVGNNTQFTATKPNAEIGKYYQVGVTWQDGATRVWDYHVDSRDTNVNIYSPYA